jgi:cyclic-di-GMP-binding protein
MATQHSFDIVSKIDMQEVTNALHQTTKEMQTRYDFKGSKSSVELKTKDHQIVVLADDDLKRRAVLDILQNKFVKRGVPLKGLTYGTPEDAAGGMVRQTISLQAGIDKENARMLVKMIKDAKLKVQAAIQEDQVRVTANKIDDLQAVISLLREADLSFDMQFVNYR